MSRKAIKEDAVCSFCGRTEGVVEKLISGPNVFLVMLFSQGYVSSELFVDSAGYRTSVRSKIGAGHSDFQNLFSPDGFVAAEFEIVYPIVGDCTDRHLSNLPFFSKVNLRTHSRVHRRHGVTVTLDR